MSSSSRSIAAARQKRAGEQSQQINTSRPVTSISSQAAFAQQYQQQRMPQNVQSGGKNVRPPQNINQNNAYTNQPAQQSTKISVSNAIGLITLRLGKLEEIVNDISVGGDGNINNGANNMMQSDMKLVSDEVFENIVNRLNLLESKILNKNIDTYMEKIDNETNEMKNVIANLHNTFHNFMNETNEKFVDYENALALIEENNQLNIATTNDHREAIENIENTETNEIDKTNENIVLENIE